MGKKSAFTLIELLVVIAIIALLLAIFAPALRKARKQARTAACQMNLRQWGTTLATIAEDNEGRFLRDDSMMPEPLTALWILTGRAIKEKTDAGDLQAPRQYHPVSTKGMLCPEASRPAGGSMATGGPSGGWGVGGTTWKYDTTRGTTNRAWVFTDYGDPTTDEARVIWGSYGLNGWLFQRPGGALTPTERFDAARSSKGASYTNVLTLRHPARMPLLLDCAYYSSSPTDDSSPPPGPDITVGSPMAPFCMNRHRERTNSLFLDWSVRKVALKELWTLKWYEGFNTAGPWTKAGGVRWNRWPPWMRDFRDY